MRLRDLAAVLAVFFLSVGAWAAKPDQTVVLEGKLLGSQAVYKISSIYYVPFDVPPGVTRLTIDCRYTPEPPGRLGLITMLFDSRGWQFNTDGFRGRWNPSCAYTYNTTNPAVITSSPSTTSRCLIAGPIQSGRWAIGQLFAWRSRVVETVDYKYTITFSFDGPSVTEPLAIDYHPGIINPKPGWYRADFHSHTYHSDGTGSLEELVARHAADGYDVVTVTDHFESAAHYEMPKAGRKFPGILLLAGEEISSMTGEANGIGLPPGQWMDGRMTPGDGRLPKMIDKAHRLGAIVSINHAKIKPPLLWQFPESEWEKIDAMELPNGGFFGADDFESLAMWDGLLKRGRRLPIIGGSDCHNAKGPINNFTYLWAENLSKDAVLEAVRKGHAFVTLGANGPRPYLSVAGTSALPGDTINAGSAESVNTQVRVVNGAGCTLHLVSKDGDAWIPLNRSIQTVSFAIPIPASDDHSYVRAEISNPKGYIVSLTNPIYIRR